MANNKLTIAQYNKLLAGYAETKGYNPENLTEDQAHELVNLMEADGIFRPKQGLALPGTAAVNDENPTAGNSGELMTNATGKAATKAKGGATAKRKVSVADRDGDMERVQSQLAAQGYNTGKFNAQIYAATYERGFNSEMTDFFVGALVPTTATDEGVEAFLNKLGY